MPDPQQKEILIIRHSDQTQILHVDRSRYVWGFLAMIDDQAYMVYATHKVMAELENSPEYQEALAEARAQATQKETTLSKLETNNLLVATMLMLCRDSIDGYPSESAGHGQPA